MILLYTGMLAALDDSVGAVVQTLKANGMYDNTVILFTTDNGGPANGFDANAANNFPLRYCKFKNFLEDFNFGKICITDAEFPENKTLGQMAKSP